jgi:hypothetical protein
MQGSLILQPGILPFPIVLSDSLLPGDPRIVPAGGERTSGPGP